MAHAAPDYLFGFEVTGPPNTTAEVWASRPSCGIAPFVYSEVMLGPDGTGQLVHPHDATTSCSDALLGAWTVWAVAGGVRSPARQIIIENSGCADRDCTAVGSYCPATDAGALPPPDGGMEGSDGGVSPPAPDGCTTVLDMPGEVHVSTPEMPNLTIHLPALANMSFHRMEVSLDVLPSAFGTKQGQYQVFTLMRGRRWVGGAVGYVALVGPGSRSTVMVANLGLPDAAGRDGRRVSRSYAYDVGVTYHMDYFYDVDTGTRRLDVSRDGVHVTDLSASTVVDSIDIEPEGAQLGLGGEQVDGTPEAATIGWRFDNVRVRACP